MCSDHNNNQLQCGHVGKWTLQKACGKALLE